MGRPCCIRFSGLNFPTKTIRYSATPDDTIKQLVPGRSVGSAKADVKARHRPGNDQRSPRLRDRFEELMADPCCASCDCDALTSEVAAYLDHKTCNAERCRALEERSAATMYAVRRDSMRALNEGGARA